MRRKKPTSFLSASFLPTTAVLEMTYRCNHTCIFCSCPWFAPEKKYPVAEEISSRKWREIIDDLCGQGVTHVAFTGGEPLLKEGIEDIIVHAATRAYRCIESKNGGWKKTATRPRLYLLSNGLALNGDVLKLCRRFNVQLSLSLPGLATFQAHTNVDNALGVLDLFRKAREMKIRTTVGITVTRWNLSELYETIAAAFIAGADSLLMNRFLPGGRGLDWSRELFLDGSEMKIMMDTAEEVLKRSDRAGSMGTEIPKCMVDADRYSHLRIATRCSAARDFFVIDPSGYVRVCNHSPERLSHADEIGQLRCHPYWNIFATKDYLPDSCGRCRLMKTCDGGCREAAHIIGHEVNAEDPLFLRLDRKTAEIRT